MTRLEAWRLIFSGLTALATGLVALVAVLSYLKVQEVFSPPSAPRTLTAVVTNGNVDLRWEKPAYLAETVAGYRILRRVTGQSAPGDFTAVAELDATSYLDSVDWEHGVQFVYRVVAVGLNGRTSTVSRYINCRSTHGCVDNAGDRAGHNTQP